ncbi:MAG: YicC/YloC family endoribonuclease, partial [Planctomycetota bacterium]
MTGFGAASSEARGGFSLRLEVRSVNHRHLAFKARLPEEFAALEPEVEARVRAACERGAVSVHLSAERTTGSEPARVDHELARRYQQELLALARALELAPELSLDTLVMLPGVLSAGAPSTDTGEVHKAVLALLEQALERMLAMRTSEGEALAADLRKNARALTQLAARIEKRMPRVVRAHHAALEKRVQTLLGKSALAAGADLARELALLADKLDVAEELTRLA